MKPTEETIKELELLFELVPPDELRKNITFLLLKFLALNPQENPPEDANHFFENMHLLVQFLERAQVEKNVNVPNG